MEYMLSRCPLCVSSVVLIFFAVVHFAVLLLSLSGLSLLSIFGFALLSLCGLSLLSGLVVDRSVSSGVRISLGESRGA